ncbi:hypothetical protein JXR93_10170 [bacterium]|nr:hypothetical protein [bacterium]
MSEEFLEKRLRIQSILYGKLVCVNCGEKIKGVRYWVKASEDKDPDLKAWCRFCAGIEKTE